MSDYQDIILDPLSIAADAIDVDTVEINEGTVSERGQALWLIDQMLGHLRELAEALRLGLADAMPTDSVPLPANRRLVRTPRPEGKSWNNRAVREDVFRGVVSKVALDPETGEIGGVRKHAAEQTLDWVSRTWTLGSPKTGQDSGLRALGLDPDDYRSFIPKGYEVKVAEIPEEAGPSTGGES